MSGSSLASVTEIVPQFAYDLIGRVIPGTIVIVVGIVAVVGPDKITLDVLGQATELLNAWSALLFAAGAYVLAFVIEGISLVVWSGWDGMGRSAQQQPLNCDDAQAVDETLQFDLINHTWPHAGARLTKLYAESTLCRTLVIGWSMAAVANLVCAVGEIWIGIACSRLYPIQVV